MSEKYQCTFTGMTPTTIENGPMRYVREVDYDLLQAKVEELETTVKDLVGVAQYSSYGRHYLRAYYPSLKQEGE